LAPTENKPTVGAAILSRGRWFTKRTGYILYRGTKAKEAAVKVEGGDFSANERIESEERAQMAEKYYPALTAVAG